MGCEEFADARGAGWGGRCERAAAGGAADVRDERSVWKAWSGFCGGGIFNAGLRGRTDVGGKLEEMKRGGICGLKRGRWMCAFCNAVGTARRSKGLALGNGVSATRFRLVRSL